MEPLKALLESTFRKPIIFTFQLLVIISAFLFSFIIRFDSAIPAKYWVSMVGLLPALIGIKLIVFWRMKLFSGWWRYISLPDLVTLLKANILASGLFLVYVIFVFSSLPIPRSVPILDFILCFLLMSGTRVFTRILRERSRGVHSKAGKKVLVIGAGGVGQMIAKEIYQNPHLEKNVVGYLDDDLERQGQTFQGLPVLGALDDLEKICRVEKVETVIIAQPAVSSRQLRKIAELCRRLNIRSQILPALGDILQGRVSVQHIRDVQIEDLLGRKQVSLDVENIANYLREKKVLITGAGGSIGSEICRQVAVFDPECMVLFDNAETPLFHIENELMAKFPGISLVSSLGDIRNRSKVDFVFSHYRPDVVFHAAAYKHVPMSESNSVVVAENNILGTRILADAAHCHGIDHFVMVSTDKAVNPTNVMGATKRAAEIYVQTLARKSSVKFVTVRFGNVLGSNGSVVPIFKEQIQKGGPVTVTHPEITRFFMTIPEAVQLVLQAGCMGMGGEIFLLDMGNPVKVLHLAEEIIRLSGLRPYEDIDIVFSGLRPGEKLHEELMLAGEGVLPTRHDKIRVMESAFQDAARIFFLLEKIERAVHAGGDPGLRVILREMVPEFQPEHENTKKSRAAHPEPKLRILPVGNT